MITAYILFPILSITRSLFAIRTSIFVFITHWTSIFFVLNYYDSICHYHLKLSRILSIPYHSLVYRFPINRLGSHRTMQSCLDCQYSFFSFWYDYRYSTFCVFSYMPFGQLILVNWFQIVSLFRITLIFLASQENLCSLHLQRLPYIFFKYLLVSSISFFGNIWISRPTVTLSNAFESTRFPDSFYFRITGWRLGHIKYQKVHNNVTFSW